MSSIRTVYLVRHGESEANLDPTAYKKGDHAIGLTPRGAEQAIAAAERLAREIAAKHPGGDPIVWTSPYERCRRTAAPIAERLGCPLKENVLIREQEFGLFDGLTDDECGDRFPEWIDRQKRLTACLGKFYFRYPGGESRADVAQRVHQFFGTLHRDEHDPVVVVCHGVTIRAFLMMWLHYSVEWFEKEANPANCSIRGIHCSQDLGYLV
ncbi:MAG: histidine phosphatase family protein [Planctomycetota bacterium]